MSELTSTIAGYPRIGRNRELKKALEAYWSSKISASEFEDSVASIVRATFNTYREHGLKGSLPDSSTLYDQVLDTTVLFGAIPPRFEGKSGLDLYFSLARGDESHPPLEMTKYFDTNYHYLVPENKDLYTSKDALKGLKVGAQKGTIQSNLISAELTESKLFELDKYPALALEVQNGNIAGLVADEAVGQGLIDTSAGKLSAANFTFTSEAANVGKAVVMAKGNDALKAAVNATIEKMVADGSWDKAYAEAVALAQTLGIEQ